MAHRARDRGVRGPFRQEFSGGQTGGDLVIDGVEDLVAQTVFFHAKVDDLTKVTSIDVAPGIAFA